MTWNSNQSNKKYNNRSLSVVDLGFRKSIFKPTVAKHQYIWIKFELSDIGGSKRLFDITIFFNFSKITALSLDNPHIENWPARKRYIPRLAENFVKLEDKL